MKNHVTLTSSYNEILQNIEGLVNKLVIDERLCEQCFECYDSKTTPNEALKEKRHVCPHCWNFDPCKRENDRINDALNRKCDEEYDRYCDCGGDMSRGDYNGVCADCR